MNNPTIFNQLLIWPFLNLLLVFYKFFEIARVPGAFGWAIIALTVTIRGLLQPMTKRQMESARKMQMLKPHLDEINKKHKGDKKKTQEEQMKLYKEHGINPAAGCLPLLLSFPILIALYQVFIQVLSGELQQTIDQINSIVYFPFLHIETLDLSFFGLNLAHKPSQWGEHGWWLLAIPVITGILQWYQMKSMSPSPKPAPKKEPKKGDAKTQPDMAADMQKQMAYIFPFMIGYAAYNFPIGLALYWNTYSLLTIWGQRKVQPATLNKS